jgi:hypothetical protein
MWPAEGDNVHYYILRRFPYTVYYEFHATTVTALAIAPIAGARAIGRSVQVALPSSAV